MRRRSRRTGRSSEWWRGGGWESIYENDQSDKVLDRELAAALQVLFDRHWCRVARANQPKSPCPTLKVIGTITEVMSRKEELKRMKPGECCWRQGSRPWFATLDLLPLLFSRSLSL